MKPKNFENFFSLDACEFAWENQWTKTYLVDWEYREGKENHRLEKENLSRRPVYQTHLNLCDPKKDQDLLYGRLDDKYRFNSNTTNSSSTASEDESFVEENSKYIVEVELCLSDYPVLGKYFSDTAQIGYYQDYANSSVEIQQVVNIHERMHAFHHSNNVGGQRFLWTNFPKTSPVHLEFIAQLFTYNAVKGTYLEKSFKKLSESQPFIYQLWMLCQNRSEDDVFQIYKRLIDDGDTGLALVDSLATRYDDLILSLKMDATINELWS